MDNRAARQFRQRLESLAGSIDRRASASGGGTARRLVQVYDGGAMGSAPNLFYLTNPVYLDGAETEGSIATPVVDTTTSIPVVVLGHAPTVGDILPAFAVGGRWVAERGGGSPGCCCVWACADTPPPDYWTVYDPAFDVTIRMPKVQCESECGDDSGSPVYCLWQASTTVDFPGSDQCPAFAGVVVTYNIGCYSSIDFGGSYNFFWISCGFSGEQFMCPNMLGVNNMICPGNTLPYPTGFDYGTRSLYAPYSYNCVTKPESVTVTQHAFGGAGGINYGAPWVLYGLQCGQTTDYSFTLTPGPSTADCGCAWICDSDPPPTSFSATLTGNGVTLGPYTLQLFSTAGCQASGGFPPDECYWGIAVPGITWPAPIAGTACPASTGADLTVCLEGGTITYGFTGMGGAIEGELPACSSRPYAGTMHLTMNPSVGQFSPTFMALYQALGGVCNAGVPPTGTFTPATIPVTITVSES